MELAELADLIMSRRSVRSWKEQEVPENLLLKAVELATWAPNAGNQQNWHFYVVLDRKTIGAIADAAQARADEIAAWPEQATGAAYGRRQVFFRPAPALVAVAASPYRSPPDQIIAVRANTDPRAREMQEWRRSVDSGIQSVASAIATMLLVLHQMGLGTVWMTGPLQAKGDIEKIIGVPTGQNLAALVAVGYAAATPAARPRRPLADVCTVVR